jgi:hypothetical protein
MPISGIRLVWGFLCQGVYHAIFVVLVIPFFCSTRAASILPPRPHIFIVVARSGGQGRRFFSAAEGSSLTAASTAAGCRRRVVGRARIRGEPAIGRDQSRTTLVFG